MVEELLLFNEVETRVEFVSSEANELQIVFSKATLFLFLRAMRYVILPSVPRARQTVVPQLFMSLLCVIRFMTCRQRCR